MKALTKKGSLAGLKSGAIALVVLGMVVGIALLVLDGFQGATTANSEAYNSIGAFITGIGDFANWPATIVVILIGAAILGLIATKFKG